jgi:hypothetical protein
MNDQSTILVANAQELRASRMVLAHNQYLQPGCWLSLSYRFHYKANVDHVYLRLGRPIPVTPR